MAALVVVVLWAGRSDAAVFDDFTTDPVFLQTDGTPFDFVRDTHSWGSPGDGGGAREVQVQEGPREGLDLTPFDNVSVQVTPLGGGLLRYEADGGLTGINTFVAYEPSLPVNLSPLGENALVLAFESADFDDPRTGEDVGYLDLSIASQTGGAGLYLSLPSRDEPFDVVIDFSMLGQFSPEAVTYLRLGTSNGNLPGVFTLSSIESRVLINGDYNGDGVVDAADYTVWRDARANVGNRWVGDGSGNGEIDAADYVVWTSSFTNRGGSPVPTPTAGWLAAVAITLGFAGKNGLRLGT
ncbi:MAG: hypothetical protein AAF805_09540 [Planctomycetota bacterium]